LTDVESDVLDAAKAKLDVDGMVADLASKQGVDEFISDVGTNFDIWVHAAGITGAKGDPLQVRDEDWDHALNIDFMSSIRLARHLGPAMIDKGWGRIVFVTSENVAQPYPDETVYNASKSALLSLTKSIAMQHSGVGLLVNCVAPAFIETPMTDGMMQQRAEEKSCSFDEAVESFLKEQRPYLVLGRRGTVAEVAPTIALLCSNRAGFTTGANDRVDGARSAPSTYERRRDRPHTAELIVARDVLFLNSTSYKGALYGSSSYHPFRPPAAARRIFTSRHRQAFLDQHSVDHSGLHPRRRARRLDHC